MEIKKTEKMVTFKEYLMMNKAFNPFASKDLQQYGLINKEAQNLPPGAIHVKNPQDVPKGWSVTKGPRGGTIAIPPAGASAGKGEQPQKQPVKQEPEEEPNDEFKIHPNKKISADYDVATFVKREGRDKAIKYYQYILDNNDFTNNSSTGKLTQYKLDLAKNIKDEDIEKAIKKYDDYVNEPQGPEGQEPSGDSGKGLKKFDATDGKPDSEEEP
jgi:hypothetical protein